MTHVGKRLRVFFQAHVKYVLELCLLSQGSYCSLLRCITHLVARRRGPGGPLDTTSGTSDDALVEKCWSKLSGNKFSVCVVDDSSILNLLMTVTECLPLPPPKYAAGRKKLPAQGHYWFILEYTSGNCHKRN